MNAENFTYWLKGYVEQIDGVPTPEQWEKIKGQMNISLYPRQNIAPYVAPQLWQTPVQYWPMPPTITCGAH
ncbi:TPA: hypothetical protein R4104_001497 [Enterobacter asburiae]|uniref:hypothetical protein n=1 Tax=Enterobacter asburiae TaxID=61645 RepID=UPI00265D96DF|nr:hypothetical protein [Enterobacter asburiae]HCM9127860.1 hypothetical protein [Enterobacter asburiae]HED1589929.1 hypothetical protein [Enterobacter asburiae]HED2713879.1 hypothetical protein [Enterobacter asburiae]HED3276637.1 hypothetical protein [Enterobacter asburiae]